MIRSDAYILLKDPRFWRIVDAMNTDSGEIERQIKQARKLVREHEDLRRQRGCPVLEAARILEADADAFRPTEPRRRVA